MIFQLDDELWFPDPRNGDADGCIAVGGDLSVDRLLLAYSNGIFPWYAFQHSKEPIWFCPMQRFVIFPKEIHISHSMRTLINKRIYEVTINQDFEGVISHCSSLRIEEEGAWLGEDMIKAYTELHRQSFAHSVEIWEKPTADSSERKLVGGLYGVGIRRCFFGESMFSLVPNASKLALIFLAQFFERNNGLLIDCQFETAHLKSMGGRFISYKEYMRILRM